MADQIDDSEALLERAFEVADRHFAAATQESAELSAYVAIAMIEVSTNAALEALGAEDAVALLRDLADQIESGEAGDDDED